MEHIAGYENQQRLTDRMEKYWNLLKNNSDALPSFSQFNPDILADLRPSLCELRIVKEANNRVFYYAKVGDNIKKDCGDLENTPVSKMIKRIPGGAIIDNIESYIEGKNYQKPLLNSGTLLNKENKLVRFRSCALLFANKGNEPSNIVLGLSWRLFN
jgi:hypothetical protein